MQAAMRLVALALLVASAAAVASGSSVASGSGSGASGERLMPTRPIHAAPSTPFTGSEEHVSNYPSVKVPERSAAMRLAERTADDAAFEALRRAGKVNERGESLGPRGVTQDDKGRPYDDSTVDFLERASTTLSSVLQHDARDVFHFKAMVARAKRTLEAKQYDQAAVLFKEATAFYFDQLKAPYAKISSSRALGETIEQRMAAQLEQERGAGVATANTAAQQFREKELQNQPHVHTAMIEYQLSLKKSSNARAEKKAAKQRQKQHQLQQQPNKRR